MDAAAHYRQLVQLGRDEFLAAAAPAALVRYRSGGELPTSAASTVTIDDDRRGHDEETAAVRQAICAGEVELEVYPLAKKPGASFPDRITIGRTANNDVVIADHSVSRLHAYVQRDGDGRGWWRMPGSKNGSCAARACSSSRARSSALAVADGAAARRGRLDVLHRARSVRALGGA